MIRLIISVFSCVIIIWPKKGIPDQSALEEGVVICHCRITCDNDIGVYPVKCNPLLRMRGRLSCGHLSGIRLGG
jgi:hypothetical protein